MTVTYFDSSALMKLLLDEVDSDVADSVWDSSEGALSSRLAYPEVRAGLASARRNHRVDDVALIEAEAAWEAIWMRIQPVDLSEHIELGAGALAGPHSLSGADAVHLASAMAVADADLVVAVWDRRLHAACVAAGLAVMPARLP